MQKEEPTREEEMELSAYTFGSALPAISQAAQHYQFGLINHITIS